MQLVSIIPRLPPVIDGVGDYALSLARQMRKDFGVETHFIVGDPTRSGADCIEGFSVSQLLAQSSADLFSLLSGKGQMTVLLHYGGYGYAKRGCPVWLVDAFERWRADDGGRFLLTMFHELYASGPPWTSAFWLSRLQRNLAARLARLSDHCFTSMESYAEKVRDMGLGTHLRAQHLPVFSSIGEPEVLPPSLSERRRRLVVFGTRGRRIQVYLRSAAELNRICSELEIEEILDIGRPLDFDAAQVMDAPVIAYGEVPAQEVGGILLDAVAGVLDYPAEMLGKSTIFAAYCAHRLVPIIAAYGSAAPADGLKPGVHYRLVNSEDEKLSLSVDQLIADNAYDWYQTHTLSIHAQTLAACLASKGLLMESLAHA